MNVVINNAGLAPYEFQAVYGTERTLAVNVVVTFLLAVQLIPKLKQTSKIYGSTPHMTFVSWALYDVGKYPENRGDGIFTSYKSYDIYIHQFLPPAHVLIWICISLSSYFYMLAIIKLSSITNNLIVINSLNPCFCKRGLGGESSGSAKLARAVLHPCLLAQ